MRRTIALVTIAALAGCGDIIGLDGYTDGDGSIADVTNGDGGGDASNDVVQKDGGGDAPNEAAPCNTQTSVCVADLPSGWAWAVYDPDARVACATGYGTPKDVEEGIDAGAATCGCGCTTTNPDCHSGTLKITGGSGGTCTSVTNQTDVADAGCNTLTQFVTSNGSANASATPPTPVGGSCTPSGSQTIPGVGYGHQGRTCALAGTAAGGCNSGEVCVPNPAPFTTCIAQAGAQTCPSAFPTQHVIGSAIADTRGCTACGCTFDAGSCAGSLTLWTDTACSNNSTPITANGTCTNVGNHTWRGYSYTSQTTASCSGAPVAPDGGVVFSDLTTVCCK
jgi:hypothetical protein